jgi:hypothetical protein
MDLLLVTAQWVFLRLDLLPASPPPATSTPIRAALLAREAQLRQRLTEVLLPVTAQLAFLRLVEVPLAINTLTQATLSAQVAQQQQLRALAQPLATAL